MKRKDLTGQMFGAWKVLRYLSYPYYICLCTLCNTEHKVAMGNLRSGSTQSCKQCSYATNPGSRTHGMSRTRIYSFWSFLRHLAVPVHKEWVESFERFYADTHEGYADNLFLGRIDRSKKLGPDNFTWGERQEEGSRFVTMQGRTMSMANWAREVGISRQAMEQRIIRSDDPQAWGARKYSGLRKNRKSKYRRLYGLSLDQIGAVVGMHPVTVRFKLMAGHILDLQKRTLTKGAKL